MLVATPAIRVIRLAMKVFSTRKNNGLEADLLQADGIAQIGDAGNDAEDQQRNDHKAETTWA